MSTQYRLHVPEGDAERQWIEASEEDLREFLAMTPEERMRLPPSRLEDLWPAHREIYQARLIPDAKVDAIRSSWAYLLTGGVARLSRAVEGAKRRVRGCAHTLSAMFRRRAPGTAVVVIDAAFEEASSTPSENGSEATMTWPRRLAQSVAAVAGIAAVSWAIRAVGHGPWAATMSDTAPTVVLLGAVVLGRVRATRWTAAAKTCAAVQSLVAAGAVLEACARWPGVNWTTGAATGAMLLLAGMAIRAAWCR
jgi:hypothetical protein